MKSKFLLLSIASFIFSFSVYSQNGHIRINDDNLESFIKEVYAERANDLVLDHEEELSRHKNILKDQIFIIDMKTSKKINQSILSLSSVSINKKYNSSLKRDSDFNPTNFNPFKYNFDFNSNKKLFYQVDGTSYVIVINSKK